MTESKSHIKAGENSELVNVFTANPDDLKFNPWNIEDEPTPASCPLTRMDRL